MDASHVECMQLHINSHNQPLKQHQYVTRHSTRIIQCKLRVRVYASVCQGWGICVSGLMQLHPHLALQSFDSVCQCCQLPLEVLSLLLQVTGIQLGTTDGLLQLLHTATEGTQHNTAQHSLQQSLVRNGPHCTHVDVHSTANMLMCTAQQTQHSMGGSRQAVGHVCTSGATAYSKCQSAHAVRVLPYHWYEGSPCQSGSVNHTTAPWVASGYVGDTVLPLSSELPVPPVLLLCRNSSLHL